MKLLHHYGISLSTAAGIDLLPQPRRAALKSAQHRIIDRFGALARISTPLHRQSPSNPRPASAASEAQSPTPSPAPSRAGELDPSSPSEDPVPQALAAKTRAGSPQSTPPSPAGVATHAIAAAPENCPPPRSQTSAHRQPQAAPPSEFSVCPPCSSVAHRHEVDPGPTPGTSHPSHTRERPSPFGPHTEPSLPPASTVEGPSA